MQLQLQKISSFPRQLDLIRNNPLDYIPSKHYPKDKSSKKEVHMGIPTI